MRSLISIALTGVVLMLVNAPRAEAADRRVKIINNTDYTMIKFQASNTKRKSWEEDMLGKSTVSPGGSFVANINDGTGACMFDFRATFQGNREATRRNINVCKITSWTIND